VKAFRNDPAAICCGLGKGKEVKETGVPRSVFKYLRYVPNGSYVDARGNRSGLSGKLAVRPSGGTEWAP